jgi:hypothetical protein
MTKIKSGYNGKELEIKIYGRKYQSAEMWLVQKELPNEYQETLSYCTLEELLELKKEVEIAIAEMVGIKFTS